MPTITIAMSDEAYRVLRQATQVRAISGNLHGAIDAFAAKVVESVDSGKFEFDLKTREERAKEGPR